MPIPAGRRCCLRACRLTALLALLAGSVQAEAGKQQYGPMFASIRTALSVAVRDRPASSPLIQSPDYEHWLQQMSPRLQRWVPDERYRLDLLHTIHYEASRAGLDPQLILSVIEVESGFRKYAISRADARGYMQIMPFWTEVIGGRGDNLFHMRTNLRYGCTILRHYLDIEQGNLFRALGRYNGSLGRAPYPNRILQAWEQNWSYEPKIDLAADRRAAREN